ncbi:MAG: ATP-binding protein, partial [Spirochaetales bacterium]|nr:ATP-binding protein [Spirochaetales bacterium]
RFDLKSRKSLKGEEKYYLADLSIYYALNIDSRINYGPALENVIFTYLKSKQYELSVGRIKNWEVDFIARKYFDDYFYIQVSMTIFDSIDTENREYRPLEAIRDNYPKYLFTLDMLEQHRKGIRHLNLIDFIFDNKDL